MGKLILFGGHGGMGSMNETTWAWDSSNWVPVRLNPLPQGRSFAAMAATLDGRLILLFGGFGVKLHGDTWTLTSAWSADTRSPAPPPRAYASLAPDPTSNSLLLFGGESASGRYSLGDTWAWGP